LEPWFSVGASAAFERCGLAVLVERLMEVSALMLKCIIFSQNVISCFVTKKGPMKTQQLLQSKTWPELNARFSSFSFATGTAGEVPSTGFGGRVNAVDDAQLVSTNSMFDLASLTKLYTATVAAKLHVAGQIDIHAPLASWFDTSRELGELTTAELLTHSSGLPAVWEEQASRNDTIKALLGLIPDQEQRGTLVYSCTGYSLFAVACEALMGKRFDQIVQEQLLDPLDLRQTGYLPRAVTEDIAVSCEPFEALELGAVHDPRARSMDGVSGNAGLFATSGDVFRFFSEILTGEAGVVKNDERKILFTPLVSGDWEQSIGFRFRDAERLGPNKHFFSHTGFTGTLVMVEPDSQQVAVMLTNRLVCETTGEEMVPVYREFSESVTHK
jgi:CubicO group peptidase (beta-lactamase class C family)